MELITAKEKKKIKDCKTGDLISVTETIDLRFPYLNIVVPKSVTLEYLSKGEKYAFNVIALEDGRVRTFHPESEVWVFDKFDVLINKIANIQ